MSNTQVVSGTWKLYNLSEEYSGLLHFNTDERFISLELIIQATDDKPLPSFPCIGRIPYIVGSLHTGGHITLYDCRTGKGNSRVYASTRLIVHANYAFWGLNVQSKDDLRFKGVSVDFGDILNWYDLCHFEQGTPVGNTIGSYHWESKKTVVQKYNDNLTISFSPISDFFAGTSYRQESILRQNVIIRFDYTEDVTWETVLGDLRSIQYLIGLGTEQIIEIGDLKYRHKSIYYEISNGTRHHTEADVSFGIRKRTTAISRRSDDYLFLFQDILSLQSGFDTWISSYEKLKPVLDLMFAVYDDVGTTEIAFLCLVQALETLHSRFFARTLGEYRIRVSSLMGGLEKELKERWEEFLFDDNQKQRKDVHLRSRLSDLFYADGVLPIFLGEEELTNYITKLVDTRNYYTHYDDNKRDKIFSTKELLYVNSYLICLLEYHLLVIIGFSKEYALDRIKHFYSTIRYSEHSDTFSEE